MNTGKTSSVSSLLCESRRVAGLLMDQVWASRVEWVSENKKTGEKTLKVFCPSENRYDCPKYLDYNQYPVDTWLSARMLSTIITQICGMIGAAVTMYNRRCYRRDKLVSENKRVPAKLIQNIEKFPPLKPNTSKINLDVSSKNAVFIPNKNTQSPFYGYVKMASLGSLKGFVIPVLTYPYFRKFTRNGWRLCGGFRITDTAIELNWEKDEPKHRGGHRIGVDPGLVVAFSTSDGQQTRPSKHNRTIYDVADDMSRAVPGSRRMRRLQEERTNLSNYAVNQLNFNGSSVLYVEDMKKIKFGRRTSKLLKHFSSPALCGRLRRRCLEAGVQYKDSDRAYKSQRCSGCGLVLKKNRKDRIYRCCGCHLEIDSDINSGINHRIDLPDFPEFLLKHQLNRKGFYWQPSGFFNLDGDALTVGETVINTLVGVDRSPSCTQ